MAHLSLAQRANLVILRCACSKHPEFLNQVFEVDFNMNLINKNLKTNFPFCKTIIVESSLSM